MVWCGQRPGAPADSGDETASPLVEWYVCGVARRRALSPVAVAGHYFYLALAAAGVMAVDRGGLLTCDL